MLKNVSPLLSPDALYALAAMGHGDEVVVCDSHYPGDVAGKQSGYGKVIRMDGADSAQAVRAILSVFPLDTFVPSPAERMMVDSEPEELPQVQREVQIEVDAANGVPTKLLPVVRSDFYHRAKKAYAVVLTGETRGWGCFIFRKGLIVTPNEPASAGTSHISRYDFKGGA